MRTCATRLIVAAVVGVCVFVAAPAYAVPGQEYRGDGASYVISGTSSPFTPWAWGFTAGVHNNIRACFTCHAGGTWSPGGTTADLFYVFHGWIGTDGAPGGASSLAAPLAVYDGGAYTCARCHTTGFTMDTVIQTGRPPELTFPGINNKVVLDPDGAGPAVSASWNLEGVQCERCHNATVHGVGPIPPRGTAATALCTQCHRQEHVMPFVAPYNTALGANIIPTPFTDNPGLPTSEPLYALPNVEVGGTGGTYAAEFYGLSNGMEFLNGGHAAYTGNFQQIGDKSLYLSRFVTQGTLPTCTDSLGIPLPQYINQADCLAANGTNIWGPGPGSGCTTCHDVHQSTVPAVNASAPFKKRCSDCHMTKAATVMSRLKHPSGTGTPLGDGSDINDACVTCHMPRPNQGSAPPPHIFRISVDPSYSTFPIEAEWLAGQKTANTRPAGAYTNAVWIDADLACGQCHVGDGGSGYTIPRNGAPWMSKAALAGYAKGIHDDSPTAMFGYTIDRFNGLKINVDASGSTCLSGTPCDEYAWDWGDGATDTYLHTATATHTYAINGTYPATLTVTDYGASSSATKTVNITVFPTDAPPVADGILSFNADTWTATLTDASWDDHGIIQITVNWGDSSVIGSDTTPPFGPFTHTYINPGTHTITQKAIDTIGQQATKTYTASPAYFTISGTVHSRNGAPLSSAAVAVKKGTTLVKTIYTTTSGTFSAGNLKPGTYTLTVTKSGYTFAIPAASVTVGPNSTGNALYATAP